MQKIASICASVSNRGRNCFASRSQKKSKRRGTTNKTKLQWRRGGQWERRKTNCRSCTQCCHLADVESWKNGRNDWYTNIYCILNSNKFFLIFYNNYNFHKIAGVFYIYNAIYIWFAYVIIKIVNTIKNYKITSIGRHTKETWQKFCLMRMTPSFIMIYQPHFLYGDVILIRPKFFRVRHLFT